MTGFLAVLILLAGTYNTCKADADNIVGGGPAGAKYNFVVRIERSDNSGFPFTFVCSGVLLDSTTVLTASYCSRPGPNVTYRASAVFVDTNGNRTKTQRKPLELVANHPDSNITRAINLLAIFKLSRSFKTKDIQLDFPQLSSGKRDNEALSAKAFVAGYGAISLDPFVFGEYVMKVKTNIIEKKGCKTLLRNYPGSLQKLLTSKGVCMYNDDGTGACFGDGGGPFGFFRKDRFVMVAMGAYFPDADCTKGLQIGMRISKYSSWIKGYIP